MNTFSLGVDLKSQSRSEVWSQGDWSATIMMDGTLPAGKVGWAFSKGHLGRPEMAWGQVKDHFLSPMEDSKDRRLGTGGVRGDQ